MQLTPQAPSVQVGVPLAGIGQSLPQAPQLSVSLLVRRHCPSQAVKPAWQVIPQTPSVHVALPLAGTVHACPQPLQCAGSDCVSTHVPLQFVVAPEQSSAQVPPSQTSLEAQGWEQPPQWLRLVWVSTLASPQRAKPGRQAKSQVPSTHSAVASAGTLQGLSQPPQ